MPKTGPVNGTAGKTTKPAARVSTVSTTASVALMAGAQALSILTAPGAQRQAFDPSFVNAAGETILYSYIAGENRIVPPLTWYGDFATKKVKNDVAIADILLNAGLDGVAGYIAGGGTFGFAPDPPTAIIGLAEGAVAGALVAGLGALRTASYRYYAGFAYSISHGIIDFVTKVFYDERQVNAAVGLPGGTLLLDDPQAWGGDHVDGGVYAVCDVIGGDRWPAQQPNAYLKSMLGGSVPAFSGKAMFVVRGPSGFEESGYFAAGFQGNPLPRPISLVVQRFPNFLGVPEFSVIRGKDANVMEVIFDWMTGRTRGFGYGGKTPLEKFDYDEFRAAAEVIFNEGLGFSGALNENVTVLQYLEDLLQFAGCVLYEHPVTGLITPKLIRRDYVVADLPVFDETNIESVEGYSPGTYRDAPNEIRLTFIDRDFNYKERPQIAQNDAAMRLLGETNSRSVTFRGIGCKETAGILAARELAGFFPHMPVKLTVNSDGEAINFGDVINWNYEKYGIGQMVLRVIGKTPSDTQANKIVLTCSMDVYGRGDVITAYPAETLWATPKFMFVDGDIQIPMIELSGTGDVADTIGYGDFNIPMVQLAGIGTVTIGGAGNFNIPMIQLNGSGNISDVGIITEDGLDTFITEDGADNWQQE